MNWDQIREKLQGVQGKKYWRSLEELADTPEFRALLEREFPDENLTEGVSRRNFLKFMGASLALAGLTSCTKQPVEKIVPYVRQPESMIPGIPLYFATAMPLEGMALGLLVESHMGRPTKVEGNPDHPASLGATDVFAQASILCLYDPDRSRAITYRGNISSWNEFYQALQTRMAVEKKRPNPGSGMRILTETVTSPTLTAQLRNLLAAFPGAKWYQYESNNHDNIREGSKLAFGEYVHSYCNLDKADVIVSLDSDFLGTGPMRIRYAREFSARRKPGAGNKMNRLYCMESSPSITGSKADHRWPVRSHEIQEIVKELQSGKSSRTWIQAIYKDLQAHAGSSIIIAGENQPPEVHAAVHAINHSLSNHGNTLIHTTPLEANPVLQMQSLRDLTQEMNSGTVDMLIVLGGNPAYDAPADLQLPQAMGKVDLRIHLGLYEDETSELCHWHIPEAHFLESWGDAVAFDGTASIIQPLIQPLYGGKSVHEMISSISGQPNTSSYDIVREHWKSSATGDFETFWRKSLHDGVIAGTASPLKDVAVNAVTLPERPAQGALELVFYSDPAVHDGRFSNIGWLQELPRPTTKITWENVVHISPKTAEKLGITNEEIVEIESGGKKISGPAWIQPGQAENSIAIHLGYGRTVAGRVGTGVGFNANAIRSSTGPWIVSAVQLRKTGQRTRIACSQGHHSMENRALVRVATVGEYTKNPAFAREMEHQPDPDETLYPPKEYNGYSWGMAIDLNACIGCNACVVACQSENNIPVVGKDQVLRGREMQWIRIDRYFEGNVDEPEIYFQPVTCMHCENAPCEVVCPVNATVHSSEGLNDMVYNRCVGTRYCSNNCPYKVRRFNFYLYSDLQTPSLKMMRNPDVTVRTRGVMEKCTYCVQRINYAKIEAEKSGRSVRDGEIVTACQQSCPAEAITFGNINDPQSKVSKLKADSLNYGLLTELNTHPRTTYLAMVRNPNPELEETKSSNEEGAEAKHA